MNLILMSYLNVSQVHEDHRLVQTIIIKFQNLEVQKLFDQGKHAYIYSVIKWSILIIHNYKNSSESTDHERTRDRNGTERATTMSGSAIA